VCVLGSGDTANELVIVLKMECGALAINVLEKMGKSNENAPSLKGQYQGGGIVDMLSSLF
jgi:hypothetical protein